MQALQNFGFYRTPKIEFGSGKISNLGQIASRFGSRVILVHGSNSLHNNILWKTILESLKSAEILFSEYQISGEPSPSMIDSAVNQFYTQTIDCVIAIGGGSVIDAGKAISAMLPSGQKISDFLEGIGTQKPDGQKVPFIAVPTTSGTGSEASANAVISQIGASGFKQSLRHENYVPDVALIDPELTYSCPPQITAACGMDTLTQLIESYVSTQATPFTDALIESALPLLGKQISNAVYQGSGDLAARTAMAYASLISGISLANAGLGVVHGLASILGAHFPIPHGVVCGTLLPSSIKYTIEKIRIMNADSTALNKFSTVYNLLTNEINQSNGCDYEKLITYLYSLVSSFKIQKLSDYGITNEFLDNIPVENYNKNNPVQLDINEIKAIISECL
jgi:alcohol dehydrogenase